MNVPPTILPGVLLLEPRRFGVTRGFFSESWSCKMLAGHGIELDFVQDNHSLLRETGTLRGGSVGIDGAITGDPILSEKDAKVSALAAFVSPFIWEGAA